MQHTIWILSGVAAAYLGWMSWLRYVTVHNETFDLAFYARMGWGVVHFNAWVPIVGGLVFGLHLSPVLVPLAVLGLIFDTVPVLIVAQALALALTAIPLAHLAARRLGDAGALTAALAWWLYPNIGHVGTFEFHPGTLAVLPLTWLIDAVDRAEARHMKWAALFVLACREDLGLVVVLVCVVAWKLRPGLRDISRRIGAWSLAYVAFFMLVLHPIFAPESGSLEAHFGAWGDNLAEVLFSWVSDPAQVLAHLGERERLLYLPKILLPLAFLSLVQPWWLLPTLPTLGISVMSTFPTTLGLDSHYLTPAVPFFVAAALLGVARLREWAPRVPHLPLLWAIGLLTGAVHALSGASFASQSFTWKAFEPDARTAQAACVLSVIPEGKSVQAPYELLPHLAERHFVHPAPPPEMETEYVVLDVSHRKEFAGQESVLRTEQEPIVRNWINRADHAVILVSGPYVVLRRGKDPRTGKGWQAFRGKVDPQAGKAFTACLAATGAQVVSAPEARGRLETQHRTLQGPAARWVELELVARNPCPSDLTLRVGTGPRPRQAELLVGGLISPAHLQRGDRLVMVFPLPQAASADAVWVGAVRTSGAKPDPTDPRAVRVELQR